ncbi:2-hydroxymuconate tautomerase [Paraburkholderia caballeronis]|uniref:Tautomerase n=1 Tax=Paraburkholderia caballeronis TaxID=416943 RepID=A0A1H7VV33_9BURK|nr:2-hydroxymuconate tautomerase [Paraburkholderia caballeronis]PXW14661.1 4-oxalocrotonate isomerase [Paraburkholderia caballeronis]PXW93489.1 4-oxalocrotonate isomerase [Paraburkholderia caballeronis]RAJ88348.1 4-oxalocrotonate isomerase [Paraburkholderia caballeronis]SEE23030.1 4-oxalocrotonate isomerase [Paraburkholderia caballeronis]SEM13202.1 4-oxalocrotonate isomerase [Paraburkholderia caballeronis]
MPIARISIMDGRTDEQKAALIAAVTEAIHRSVGAPRENIRVLLDEVPRTQWGIAGKTAHELDRH